MIVYSIIITAFLMVAVVCLTYEHIWRIRESERIQALESALADARDEITGYRIERANLDGVEAGRQSDAIFKGFLRQFSVGEQATVLLRHNDARYYKPKHGI